MPSAPDELTPEQWERVAANLKLVDWVVSRWMQRRWPYQPFEDLRSDGIIGLMAAAKGFKPELGYTFSTYATVGIRRAIDREAARREGVNLSGAAAPTRVPQSATLSMNAPIGDDGDGEFGDLAMFAVGDETVAVETVAMVERATAHLGDNHRKALPWLMGIATLDEVGKRHGVTRTTIQNWAKAAVVVMRAELETYRRKPDPPMPKPSPARNRHGRKPAGKVVWTPYAEERLVDLREGGATWAECGRAFGLSHYTVRDRYAWIMARSLKALRDGQRERAGA